VGTEQLDHPCLETQANLSAPEPSRGDAHSTNLDAVGEDLNAYTGFDLDPQLREGAAYGNQTLPATAPLQTSPHGHPGGLYFNSLEHNAVSDNPLFLDEQEQSQRSYSVNPQQVSPPPVNTSQTPSTRPVPQSLAQSLSPPAPSRSQQAPTHFGRPGNEAARLPSNHQDSLPTAESYPSINDRTQPTQQRHNHHCPDCGGTIPHQPNGCYYDDVNHISVWYLMNDDGSPSLNESGSYKLRMQRWTFDLSLSPTPPNIIQHNLPREPLSNPLTNQLAYQSINPPTSPAMNVEQNQYRSFPSFGAYHGLPDTSVQQTPYPLIPPSTSGEADGGYGHGPTPSTDYTPALHPSHPNDICSKCGGTQNLPHLDCQYDSATQDIHSGSWNGEEYNHTDAHPGNLQNHAVQPMGAIQSHEPAMDFSPPPPTNYNAHLGLTDTSLSPSPATPAYRPSQRVKSTNSEATGNRFQCVDCVKRGKKQFFVQTESTGEGRCRRCYDKHKKANLEGTPPVYSYLPAFQPNSNGHCQAAYDMVYPTYGGIRLKEPHIDDWQQFNNPQSKAHWVDRFIRAANQPYQHDPQRDGPINHQKAVWLLDQQRLFNRAQYEKTGGHFFENDYVNARMTLLYDAIFHLHAGGARPYPCGGDNAGYGKVDNDLTCSARLQLIEQLLMVDKRIVMNVIHGQHVCALAESPKSVQKRKSSNKSTNSKKAELQKVARDLVDREKGKVQETEDEADDEDDEGGVTGPGPSKKRKRRE
jgi:hypothetical protein